jgi:hypothetical protein
MRVVRAWEAEVRRAGWVERRMMRDSERRDS